MRGKLSILLSAALLLGALAACHSGASSQVDSSQSSSSSPPVLTPSGSGTADVSSQPLPEPEPEPEPVLEFDPNYKLEISYPKVPNGALELPVRGATGYASVELPLWEQIPEPEPEPPVEPEPEPPESVEPPLEDIADISAPAPEDTSAPEPGDSSAAADEAPSPFLPDFSPDSSTPPLEPAEEEPVPAPGEEPLPEPEPEPETDPFEGALAVLSPGTAFTILEEEEDWWRVECKAGTGWIEHRYCLINLPDVIPSMVYNATNSYDSRFVTLGKAIPDVTGRAFYPGKSYNARLGRDEFMMPVLYSMSKHICQAQQSALAQGNTLVLYEGYRPHATQTTVYRALSALTRTDPEVQEAVTSAPWNLSWFIAGGYSNHQRGFAIDVTLAQIQRPELQTIGGRDVLRVQEYEEYTMPTPIHELSRAAATFTAPVASHSPTAWKSATLADTMNEPALALQRYCTGAELTPLASEWWHFNDLGTRTSVLDNLSIGNFKISECRSKTP